MLGIRGRGRGRGGGRRSGRPGRWRPYIRPSRVFVPYQYYQPYWNPTYTSPPQQYPVNVALRPEEIDAISRGQSISVSGVNSYGQPVQVTIGAVAGAQPFSGAPGYGQPPQQPQYPAHYQDDLGAVEEGQFTPLDPSGTPEW